MTISAFTPPAPIVTPEPERPVVQLDRPRSTECPQGPEFLIWGYPAKDSIPDQVLRDGVAYFGRRHGTAARVVLANPGQASAIAPAADELGIELRVAMFVPRGSYYIGTESGGRGAVWTGDAS